MEIPLNTNEVIAVEYPGTVNNVSKLIQQFGGQEKLDAAFKDPSKRLELFLRPDDLMSKPCHGDKHNTNAFLLEIKKKTKKTTGEVTYELKYHGSFKNIYKFKSICDFQILPIALDKTSKKMESLLPKLIPSDLHLSDWLDEDVPLFIIPLAFSRFDTSQNGYVELNKPKTPVKSLTDPKLIGRNRAKRNSYTLYSSFQSPDVPKAPKKEALEALLHYPLEVAIKERLEVLFEQRSVWTKNALVSILNCDKSRLKYALTSTAYYCTNGPWRTLWVKFNYDPRKDPKSKVHQLLDFRIQQNIKIVESDRTRSMEFYTPFAKSATQKARIPMIDVNHFVEEKKKEEKEENDMPSYMLVPGRVPNIRQCYFQLCDILYDEVSKLVHQNDGHEHFCHEKDGWCSIGVLDKCREIVLKDIKKTATSTEIEKA